MLSQRSDGNAANREMFAGIVAATFTEMRSPRSGISDEALGSRLPLTMCSARLAATGAVNQTGDIR